MRALRQDIRFALRRLGKSPGYTVAAVLALALGNGASSGIYSLVDGFLVRPVSYPNLDRLVVVYATRPNEPDRNAGVTAADFADWRREATSFETFAAWDTRNFNMTGTGEPVRIQGAVASPGLFEALGSAPIAGRTFTPDEDQPGRDGVVMLHYTLWRDRFASDPSVVGRTITLDGRPRTVVGVMGPDFDVPLASDLWVPFAPAGDETVDRKTPQVATLGLLKPGVTAEQAQLEVRAIAERLATAYPNTNAGRSARLISFTEEIVDPYARSLLVVLAAAVGFVLLVGCANVANLQLARASARGREVAVRLALGASRTAIVRELLVESLVVAIAGGAAGLLLAQALIDYVVAGIPANVVRFVPGLLKIGLDWRVLGIALALSTLAGVIAGLLPALHASRADLGEAMKDASKGTASSSGSRRARAALVIAEVALTLAMLVGSGLLVKHFVGLVTTYNGYDRSSTLTMRIALPDDPYGEPKRSAAFYEDVLERIETLPGVESAAAVRVLPSDDTCPRVPFAIEDQPASSPTETPQINQQVVTHDYFATLRIPVLEGRAFTREDRADTLPVALVSDSARRSFWPNEDPVGKRVKVRDDGPWLTVVGVVGDVKQHWIEKVARPTVYIPFEQNARQSMCLAVRTSGDPVSFASSVRGAVLAVDPNQPVFEVNTLEGVHGDSVAGLRLATVLMALFGLMALALATVGVYGVMAVTVAQRRHEVGIRMALGAEGRDVLRMIVGHALRMAAIGVVLGLPIAFALGTGLSAALDGAIPFDPVALGAFVALLLAIVAVASLIPARRAAKTDPMVVLRYE
jgi:putative ABC transport system permease protein